MMRLPQVGDIWKWTSEAGSFTYVLLLEQHDEIGKKYWNGDIVDRFTGLQLYGEGSYRNESGDVDDWDFGPSVEYGWEYMG